VQTLTPQIDRTFVDRLIELAASNTSFRQNLTRSIVDAEIAAVESQARVEYYEHLEKALSGASGSSLSGQQVDERMNAIVTDAKATTKSFNDLYLEISRVTLRPPAGLFTVDKPVQVSSVRELSIRRVGLTTLIAFAIALVLTMAFLLVRDRMISDAESTS
jgi:hypothetical protein